MSNSSAATALLLLMSDTYRAAGGTKYKFFFSEGKVTKMYISGTTALAVTAPENKQTEQGADVGTFIIAYIRNRFKIGRNFKKKNSQLPRPGSR